MPTNAKADSHAEDDQLAHLLRELGESLRSDSPLDWRESWRRSNDVLGRFYQSSPQCRRLSESLRGQSLERGGAEHQIIRLPSHPDRYFKTTYGGAFGCRTELFPSDLDELYFHAASNGDPLFYFERWRLLNSISYYQTKFEGILPPETEGGLYRICVSQPAVVTANPTETQIAQALAAFGFKKVCPNTYFSEEDNLLLTDAAPRNVRVIEGIPVPFDAIAEIATGPLLDWIRLRLA
jgi:hypothetical protein